MAQKKLVIDSAKGTNQGDLNQWSALTNPDEFIGGIKTAQLSEDANIGALVSGIPSAFARVDLFHNAIKNGDENPANAGVKNLNSYYIELLKEWKGLIAALALDYASFEVRRIELRYSDGLDTAATRNIYEPKGAFGNMLLERRDRWKPVGQEVTKDTPPFLNVIKYRQAVVGATSPETLLFTSTGYTVDTGRDSLPWIRNGRFTDPLDASMSEDQVIALYAYVGYITRNLDRIASYYAPLHDDFLDYTPHRTVLERWKGQIEEYAKARGYNLERGTVPPVSAGFSEPFRSVFYHEDRLYSVDGLISETDREGAFPFDPKKLLLGSDARIARVHLDAAFSTNPEKVRELPVHVLRASFRNDPARFAYFALPLSAQGLDVFGKSIGSLVGNAAAGQAVPHRLTAIYDDDTQGPALSVELAITTESGKTRTFKVNYEVGNEEGIRNHDILLWPNFASRQWNAYYLYSEMPHSVSTNTYSAFPFVGDPADNFRIVKGADDRPLPLAESNRVTADTELPGGGVLKVELPVQSTPAVAENGYKYEIYRSNLPFKGVRLVSPTRADGGYLLINYTQESDRPTLPRDMLSSLRPLDKVTLGFDFGSTNTSIAYATESGPEGFSFGPQRVSLLGNELPGARGRNVPRANQVLFFQTRDKDNELHSNAIKSILTLHSPLRLHPLDGTQDDAMRASEAVAGGFPCFMENLPIKAVEKETIKLLYPRIGQVEQIHNMKWNDRDMDKAYKTAYLRTLMLQVYAALFVHDRVPDKLVWSYPSAMDNKLLLQYRDIWKALDGKQLSPVYKSSVHDPADQVQLAISTYTPAHAPAAEQKPVFGSSRPAFGQQQGSPAAGGGFGAANRPAFGQQAATPAQAEPSSQSAAPGFRGTTKQGTFGGGSNKIPSPTDDQGKRPDFKPDDPDRVTDYQATPLFPKGYNNNSLTEATAVANFIATAQGEDNKYLDICFDVGGSTTDISALWMLPEGRTMIKQNSLRFAAQLVSYATRHMTDEFEKVLRRVCSETGVKMLGLNEGENRFCADTAPYYFEQLVDRLSESQLRMFYEKIGIDCPRLLCVNMFVTGMLIFYAGQIAHKLVDDLRHLPEDKRPDRPLVRITFAGKGSRLFQWLSILPQGLDQEFYQEMFKRGYGEQAIKETLLDWPEIKLPTDSVSQANIKYEVSKGLAKGNPKLLRPKGSNASEIVAESNFEVTDSQGNRQEVKDINTLTPAMLRSIGRSFSPVHGSPAACFTAFCETYYNALGYFLSMTPNVQAFNEALADNNIVQFVQSRPEFQKAQLQAESGQPFDFVAPIIILEGMKFYDKYLFKALG